MDIDQAFKTVQWLDEERRKDKQEIAALQERLAGLAANNAALVQKVQQVESELGVAVAALQRVNRLDEIMDGYRQEMIRRLEEADQRRGEAEREAERLRKIEREGINRALVDLRKGVEAYGQLERELKARIEEERRLTTLIAELQKKVGDFNKYLDDRGRAVAVVEEGRRQDAKRIADLQVELTELRRRQDESRGKLDIVEDLARRTDARLADLLTAETERRTMQAQWLDAQALAQAERDRAWAEMQVRIGSSLQTLDDYSQRLEQFAEANREIKQSAVDFKQTVELMERRLNEAAEMQRLADERFRQDWAAFLADDQKRWTTHMLLRDEQWREHDRLMAKYLEHLEALEEQMSQVQGIVRRMLTADTARLQNLLNLAREMVAEHEQQFTHAVK